MQATEEISIANAIQNPIAHYDANGVELKAGDLCTYDDRNGTIIALAPIVGNNGLICHFRFANGVDSAVSSNLLTFVSRDPS